MTTNRLDRSHRSRSPKAAADAANAEEVLRRRQVEGLTFSSIHTALEWYFERRERQQGPHAMHPHAQKSASGEMVVLDVDGGRGGDLDDVMCTLSTISSALDALRHDNGQRYQVLEWTTIGDVSVPDVRTDVLRWVDTCEKANAIELAAERYGVAAGTIRMWIRRTDSRKPLGMTLREISERSGLSVSTCSAELGKAHGFLTGWLKAAGVVRS